MLLNHSTHSGYVAIIIDFTPILPARQVSYNTRWTDFSPVTVQYPLNLPRIYTEKAKKFVKICGIRGKKESEPGVSTVTLP